MSWRRRAGRSCSSSTGSSELYREGVVSSQQALEECGAACERLTREEAETRFGVSPAHDAEVLFQPDAGIVYADRAVEAFARGLRVEEGSRVESLDELEEPVVVVCAGPWARRLLEPAGIDLPVVETRETVAYFQLEGETPSVVAEVVTKRARLLLAPRSGSWSEGRQSQARHARRPGRGAGPDPALVAEIAEWTGERFPRANPEPMGAESCFYTTTDDERFVIERHGRIVVGSACSGHAFKFAPATGKRLAALALEALG